MLGIDPKTLRHWRNLAQIPLQAHPTDGRLKCLSMEHLQHLASIHGRPMVLPEALAPSPLVQSPPHTAPETLASQAASDLLDKLSHLETQVASIQHHLTQLTLELPQERELHYERRLQALEALVQPSVVLAPLAPLPTSAEATKREAGAPHQPGRPPTPRRSRSRVLPLIEYSAAGRYMVICPKQGELALVPDSPEWFAWLASLSSFHFVGKGGRFSAHRVFHKGQTPYWQANRVIHQHRYKPYLGMTERLTLDCLEQTAALLQSYLQAR
jgi:hypothetical protein